MSSHIFVDESKERDYLLVAAVILSDDLDATRTLVRGLVLHGQHQVHMKKESVSRKRSIASAICATGVQATIYNAGMTHRSELDARDACSELVRTFGVSRATVYRALNAVSDDEVPADLVPTGRLTVTWSS